MFAVLVMEPFTCKIAPVTVRFAAAPTFILFAKAAAEATGLLGVPDGMTTLVVLVGMPPHQLPGVFQSELLIPRHVPGAAIVTGNILGPLLPQKLPAVTVTLPPAIPEVAVMDVVPCPDVMVQPAGTPHVYVVADATGLIEKLNPAVLAQMGVEPEMAAGADGAGGLTVNVLKLVAGLLHPVFNV